jgi:flagellar biosynthetic protein FliQ
MWLETLLYITRESLLLALLLSAPALLAALVVGLIISIVQAATQIQEQTLSATPKIAAVVAVLVIFGLWMLSQLVAFAETVFGLIGEVGRGA